MPVQVHQLSSATLTFAEVGAPSAVAADSDRQFLGSYVGDGIVELEDSFHPLALVAVFMTDINTHEGPWAFDVTPIVAANVGGWVGFEIRLNAELTACSTDGPGRGAELSGFAIHLVTEEPP